ncbi:MAG: hypothetical protein ACI8W3_003153 [Myxococcota bacterium]|jgi:uncharacterized protein (TIGR03382 family)
MVFGSIFSQTAKATTFKAAIVFALGLVVSSAASAFTSGPSLEEIVHYATEPSTGTMVLAALVVVAGVRRNRRN